MNIKFDTYSIPLRSNFNIKLTDTELIIYGIIYTACINHGYKYIESSDLRELLNLSMATVSRSIKKLDRNRFIDRQNGKVSIHGFGAFNKKDYFVYLFTSAHTKCIKIGMTSNINNRIEALKTGAGKIKVIKTYLFDNFTDCQLFEHSLHLLFKDKRITGEWFEINNNDVEIIDKIYLEVK